MIPRLSFCSSSRLYLSCYRKGLLDDPDVSVGMGTKPLIYLLGIQIVVREEGGGGEEGWRRVEGG